MTRFLAFTLFLMFGLVSVAHAYLDPGTGSFILQMLVAGILGALLYIKLAWTSVKAFFYRLFSRDAKASEDKAQNPDTRESTDTSS